MLTARWALEQTQRCLLSTDTHHHGQEIDGFPYLPVHILHGCNLSQSSQAEEGREATGRIRHVRFRWSGVIVADPPIA